MKILSRRSLLIVSITSGLFSAVQAQETIVLPGPVGHATSKNARINALTRKVAKYPTYNGYQELADLYLAAGNYEDTARAYSAKADLFRRQGLIDAAVLTDVKAARYRTECRIFVNRKLRDDEVQRSYSGALLEPPIGTYVGAYIDQDDQLKQSWRDNQGRIHRQPEEFQQVVGKSHGTYFMYIGYGKPVPMEWLEQCKRAGVIPHLAYEPKDLNAVQDDAYLREFAKACGKLNWPIFLRYASEMNGNWTAWHGNPALYREKFRIVHRVFHQYAPLVATVWCVNSVPTLNIADYYPGDDHCDWVGINVYSVPFYGNDLNRPGYMDSAPSYIKPIYDIYSKRKPIAICEFAASHMAEADKVPRTEFAVSRMEYLYQSLPRFFPRVKMISWFDVNTIRHGSPSTPNNYAITENPTLLDAYKKAIEPPYFMDASQTRKYTQAKYVHSAETAAKAASYDVPCLVSLGQNVQGKFTVSLWIKTPVPDAKVYLAVNKKLVYTGTGDGAHDVALDTNKLGVGRKRLRVYVYDSQGKFLTTAATSVTIPGARERFAPLQVSGTIKRYYLDRTGSVSAVDIENLGALERIHFNPASAQKIMDQYPLFGDITAWVLPRNREAVQNSAHNLKRGWNLVGFGEEQPLDASGVYWPTDIERLATAPVVKRGGSSQKVQGSVTKLITGPNGQLMAVVLNNKDLVRLPASFRAAAKPATAKPSIVSIGTTLVVEGAVEPNKPGQVSVYGRQLVANALTVNGKKAVQVMGVLPAKRGGTAVASKVSIDPALDAAEADGMGLYQAPIKPESRVTLRGVRGADVTKALGVDQLVDTAKRPW